MVFKIAAGIALGVLLIGIVVLVLLTIVIVWSKLMKRIQNRLENDYDVQAEYTEDDFDWSEISEDIREKETAQKIKDWFEENDIEMWEEEK